MLSNIHSINQCYQTCLIKTSRKYIMRLNDRRNRARKSRRTLQNKVRIKVFPEQLSPFINTYVALKQCII